MKDRRISSPFLFSWGVHPSGYFWEQKRVKHEPVAAHLAPSNHSELPSAWYLVPCNPSELPRTYQPLQEFNGLFRTFSELAPTRESIQGFANEYGWLGLWSLPREMRYVGAESFMQWTHEVLRINPLVTLWEALRIGDDIQIAKFLRWRDDEIIYELGSDWTGTITRADLPQAWLCPGELITPAWHVLQRHLNEAVSIHPTAPSLAMSPEGKLRLWLRPQNLASGLWLQFASAVSENHSLRSCHVCTRWFQVGPDGDRRTDAEFCSNACRQKKYRIWKERKSRHRESRRKAKQ
jgi:hypothetical protein